MNLQVKITNRQILSIALPISASIVVPQINFITNNIFLGGLGQKSLALAGITGVYYLIFAVVGHGLNNGLQALISRRAGENRIDAIGNLFWQGVRISLVFAAIGILLTWLVAPRVLHWSLHDEEGVKMAVQFLNIRIIGLPFLYVYQMRNALLVGTNQSKYLILGTATEAVVNIFLDYCLIYGKMGLPALGFNGAAYASVVAEIAGLVVIFIVIHAKGISRQLQLFRSWGFDAANTKLILKQSSPLILQHTISITSWEFFYILIEHHGDQALAVSNTMRNIFGFFGCFTWAFAATTNTMVSNIIGQDIHHRVIELIHKLIKWSVGFALIVCVFLNLFPHACLSIYGQGEDFIQAAIPVLRIVSFALVLMSVSVIWLNAVTGTGNSKMNLATETAAIILYCIYNYIVLEKLNLPITWGWASEVIYWSTLLIPSFWYMHSGRWKTRKI
ncbi:MAG: MATE family efflux transporter [Sediminibacterium magnilacihabitans]|jgi:MATE family multidrug resistance protein|nr:MATE family efflux transporter [Sediminibacterium magnilacihabitans]PQV61161.1 putative MATE family efflux protein [Sediminibacterium magnilacihabitans]